MIQVVAGKKGVGKTKYILDKANSSITKTDGTIIYLDKSSQHMYELNSNVRLINITEYPITSVDSFIGFVSGIIARDFDIQQVYFDSFLKISCVEESELEKTFDILKSLSEKHNITFVISISMDADELPENIKDCVVNA